MHKVVFSLLLALFVAEPCLGGIRVFSCGYRRESVKHMRRLFRYNPTLYEKVKIGILDTGIDYNHPQLAEKITQNPTEPHFSYSFWSGPSWSKIPYDSHGHGTAVAGLAVDGVDEVEIFPKRLLSFWTSVYLTIGQRESELQFSPWIIDAHKAGVRIFNFSFVKQFGAYDFEKAILSCPNALFICAAGNDHVDTDTKPYYPASLSNSYHNVISVGACTGEGKYTRLAKWSNYGKQTVQLAAPGSSIPVLKINGGTASESGTSFSAPAVTRTCAKILSLRPDFTVREVVQILKDSVLQVDGLEDYLTWGGFLDEECALRLTRASGKAIAPDQDTPPVDPNSPQPSEY